MDTTVYDDGSTLTYDPSSGYAASTNATDTLINQSSAGFTPQGANPRASSWEDVIKFGLARVIDAKSRPVTPENAAPVYQTQSRAATIGGLSLSTLLVLGVIAYFVLK